MFKYTYHFDKDIVAELYPLIFIGVPIVTLFYIQGWYLLGTLGGFAMFILYFLIKRRHRVVIYFTDKGFQLRVRDVVYPHIRWTEVKEIVGGDYGVRIFTKDGDDYFVPRIDGIGGRGSTFSDFATHGNFEYQLKDISEQYHIPFKSTNLS